MWPEMSIPVFLSSEKIMVYKVTGKSMLPMLIPYEDLVVIKSVGSNDLLTINDIVLYFNKSKALILHRIVDITNDNSYVLLGDNCSKKEFGVSRSNIIGKLVRFKHSGINYTMDDPLYKEYVCRIRSNENFRMKRKAIYDFFIFHIEKYISSSKLSKIKTFLKRILLCTPKDIKY